MVTIANDNHFGSIESAQSLETADGLRIFRHHALELEDGVPIPAHLEILDCDVMHLDSKRVVLNRCMKSGMRIRANIPMAFYEALAVRLLPDPAGDERVIAQLEIVHRDPHLTILLSIADNPGDLAAEWAEWAELSGLPLRMIDYDGEIHTPPGGDQQLEAQCYPRRYGKPTTGRRTRFQHRRTVGNVIHLTPIEGDEIIARS